jgi:hypothetical protein
VFQAGGQQAQELDLVGLGGGHEGIIPSESGGDGRSLAG